LLAVTLVIVSIVAIIFSTRVAIINAALNNYITQHQSELTCLDLSINTDFNLIINKLCIKMPLTTIEINDAEIQWQSPTTMLLVDMISAIKIDNIKVQGTAEIVPSQAAAQASVKESSFSDIQQRINLMMVEIAQINLPSIAIEVKNYHYFPFSLGISKTKAVYSGHLFTDANQFYMTMARANETDFISIKLTRDDLNFTATLDTDLAELESFLAFHQLTLANKLAQLLSINGTLQSQFVWQEETLTINNQLSDFSIRPKNGISADVPFSISGPLQWQSRLVNNILTVEFDQKSLLNIESNQQDVIELLVTKSAPVTLIELLKNNEVSLLKIKPQDSLTIDFTKAEVFVSAMLVSAMLEEGGALSSNEKTKNINKPIVFALHDVSLSYGAKQSKSQFQFQSQVEKKQTNTEPLLSLNLNQAGFNIEAQLQLATLHSFSKNPLLISATGQVKQNKNDWQIDFEPNTTITLADISLLTKEAAIDKKKLSAAKLVSSLQGTISIVKENLARSNSGIKDVTTKKNINLALQVNSDITQLQLTNLIHIDHGKLMARIDGDLSDIKINAETFADNVPVATINVRGELSKPEIDLVADKLSISDLLALKIKRPIDVKLIDGMISYRLSGQLTDLEQPMNNAMKLSLAMEDITGEISGTWMQGLNIKQNFMLNDGHLISDSSDTNQANNIFIDKIETQTPIDNLSANFLLNFSKQNSNIIVNMSNVSAEALGGRFEIDKAQWPMKPEHSVNVQLSSIDLEKLLELDKKQGIVVTGKISGNLPVSYDGNNFLVKDGSLHNVSHGVIQVMNNPAVARLKEGSAELKLAFDALQNLHYHQLTSEVSMANDGYMLLATAIKGRNPDLDNEVNLNLNLNYDLLGLLASLDITKHIENSIIKQSKKDGQKSSQQVSKK